MKIDHKRQLREYYTATRTPVIVDVPEMTFLAVDGHGDPNTSVEYRDAVSALYAVAYAIKFALKASGIDYGVMPLEGLWWVPDMARFSVEDKSAWDWTALIMQPEDVTDEMFAAATAKAAAKAALPALDRVRLERFAEGPAAQVLHVGPHPAEGPTIAALHAFIADHGHDLAGRHHEIYLSDPRRSAPEKLKTILRQPIDARRWTVATGPSCSGWLVRAPGSPRSRAADRARPAPASPGPGVRHTGAMVDARLVLANAAAGSADDRALTAALGVLGAGGEVEVVVPTGPEDLRAALARSAGRELVVIGGDGSVHACLAELDRLGLLPDAGPVSIVPMGTGNDLARALGVPQDPAEAARAALTAPVRRLDLMRADDGGVVVNAAHAGVGAEATARAGAVKGLLGATAYAVGAVQAGLLTTGWHLRVTADGEVLHDGTERALMVSVSLGPSIGGGTPLAPQASPADGEADVLVSTATGALARLGYALALRRGTHRRRGDVRSTRGRVVTVEALTGSFRVNTDGEVGGPHRRRSWSVLPGAWRCRVPAAG